MRTAALLCQCQATGDDAINDVPERRAVDPAFFAYPGLKIATFVKVGCIPHTIVGGPEIVDRRQAVAAAVVGLLEVFDPAKEFQTPINIERVSRLLCVSAAW